MRGSEARTASSSGLKTGVSEAAAASSSAVGAAAGALAVGEVIVQ